MQDPLKEDFRKFLFVVWNHLGLPEPTPVQYDIAHYLQHGPRRKMIMAFRGVGKSWIYSAFITWRLYCNPDWKMLVVSASKPVADSLSHFVKRLIAEMPILQHLRAREDQRNTNVLFDVGPARSSKDPSVKSVGITGQLTGSRADEILADDIEVTNNSATEMARERLGEQVKEFDAVLKPGGIISFLGTPQSFMSMYNSLPERGYDIRVWPAHIPKNPEVYRQYVEGKDGEKRLAKDLGSIIHRKMEEGLPEGAPVDPARFPEEDLRERRASYGRAGYALQFMLDTSDEDAFKFPLKLADLVVMNLDTDYAPSRVMWGPTPKKAVPDVETYGFPGDRFYYPMAFEMDTVLPYSGSVMFIDPSGRGKDETAYSIVNHVHGRLFLVDIGGLKGGYNDAVMTDLVTAAARFKVKHIRVEDNFGDGMFLKLLQPHLRRLGYAVSIEGEHVTGQKELRILDALEPVMMQHRLVVAKEVIAKDHATAKNETGDYDASYSLFYQMTRLTRDKGSLRHDDRLDALAGAVRYWVESMSQDEMVQLQRHKDGALKDELQAWLKGAKGRLLVTSKGTTGRKTGYRGGRKGFRPKL